MLLQNHSVQEPPAPQHAPPRNQENIRQFDCSRLAKVAYPTEECPIQFLIRPVDEKDLGVIFIPFIIFEPVGKILVPFASFVFPYPECPLTRWIHLPRLQADRRPLASIFLSRTFLQSGSDANKRFLGAQHF